MTTDERRDDTSHSRTIHEVIAAYETEA